MALVEKYRKLGQQHKANCIEKYNLGYKKYTKQKYRAKATFTTYINTELNKFFKKEKPSEIICEDLRFTSSKSKLPKRVKRHLSSWAKGIIRERLSYKAALQGICETTVNAAYTSQYCHLCSSFGKRNGKVFNCPEHGKMDADYNASMNVLHRKDDAEIDIYTPYKQVKKIIRGAS